jgi:uncharacterized NAD(P)/FAD-binding protein YdhS
MNMTSDEQNQESIIPRIAIIGGGFSGTVILANLIALAETPFIIEWFEKDERLGAGIAYSTTDTCHLLNVRAERMGAFADKPEGFYQWLQTEDGKRNILALVADIEIAPDRFLPRALYGMYLKSILADTLKAAANKNIEIHIHNSTAINAQLYDNELQQLILSFEKGGITKEIIIDSLILATGNLPPRRFSFQPGLIRGMTYYVGDVWHAHGQDIFPHNVNQLSADSEIVIIGTGLTMVDNVLTLKAHGYKGTITALSRHGWLPHPHLACQIYPEWEWIKNPETAPQTVLGIIRRLRQEIRKAHEAGYDWRSVIDSLRPITQIIWQRLSITEKRKFLSRLFTLWNIHRHRMAPEIQAQLKAMQQNGSLKIIPSRIYYVGSDEQGVTVAHRKRGSNRIETIRATLVLNCTGPEYDIATSSHHLLRNLRDNGLLTVGPLRVGIDTNKSGSAKGKTADIIFPIGTLLMGELLECTAVPELREQAYNIALKLKEHLKDISEKDHTKNRLLGAGI